VVELFVDTVGIFVVTLSVVELFVDTVGIFVVTIFVKDLGVSLLLNPLKTV
jgi:hypothetical protein